ncbi:2-C-methyl-D-erythritol 4-phosphate cytidylyltransferase [Hyphobacterium sp. CCMP332]|nr:2-C-methyl-D-erythritol 4-phosphate cytidylyltransferase [Hyphobacterium sp. CCMP332]
MGTESPKQFIKIGSKPIIVHTIEKFIAFNSSINLILTLPEEYFNSWQEIKNEYLPNQQITLVKGGISRFDSIKNALALIDDQEGIVAIHDAVRPFLSLKIIEDCYESAEKTGSGVAAISLKDSIRETNRNKSFARDRNNYKLMQTPQTFDIKKIVKAYTNAKDKSFTDDAGVWENAGFEVNLVEGGRLNIKITYPEDLLLAEAILKA